MTHVVVAMSGGVDSSVAAVLLKQQGYEVTGMMLRLWSEAGKEDSNRCCTPDSMAQARKVAAKLDIPFYVVDAKDIFKNKVVEYFLDGYRNGKTPNPCLACNQHIRWEYLLNHALALGADFLSTGHYVRKQTSTDGRQLLMKGIDPTKDQSYVLHVLTQDKLAKALFPIGDHTKTEIRSIAAENGLSVSKRPDSQDLCFLAGGDYRSFLQRNSNETALPGKIIDQSGNILGKHNGLMNYTIGQRKGLGLTTLLPYYVLGKNLEANTLIVGDISQLGKSDLTAENINWTCGIKYTEPFTAYIKTRYTAAAARALVIPLNDQDTVNIHFDFPQRDITPGQAAVFYDGDTVLGGGLITNSY